MLVLIAALCQSRKNGTKRGTGDESGPKFTSYIAALTHGMSWNNCAVRAPVSLPYTYARVAQLRVHHGVQPNGCHVKNIAAAVSACVCSEVR